MLLSGEGRFFRGGSLLSGGVHFFRGIVYFGWESLLSFPGGRYFRVGVVSFGKSLLSIGVVTFGWGLFISGGSLFSSISPMCFIVLFLNDY